jgi:hypothetical protein
MSSQGLEKINRLWAEQMVNDKYGAFLTYSPFSEKYWTEKYKIVLCNLESYSHEDTFETKEIRLDIDRFKNWLSYKMLPTPRKSALILYALHKILDSGQCSNKNELSNILKDDELLIEPLLRSTYMNLRKEIGEDTKEDRLKIHKFLNPNYKKNEHNITKLKEFIKELNPTLFVITGETGADIISRIYKDSMSLYYKSIAKSDGVFFASISHPSVISYEEIINLANEIKTKID